MNSSSKELKKLVKLITQARNAVKNAGNQIAEAHAQSVAYDLPGREIIGHLRDLNDGLYGLSLYCQHEVEQAAQRQVELDMPEKGAVVPKAKGPHGDRVQTLGAACPKCHRQVVGLVGAINSCGCGAHLRRADTGAWFEVPDKSAEAALKAQAGAKFAEEVRARFMTTVRMQSKKRNDPRRNQKG